MKWTLEEDALLRALFEAGNRPMLVAAKLKRSLPATKVRAHFLGISLRRITLWVRTKK